MYEIYDIVIIYIFSNIIKMSGSMFKDVVESTTSLNMDPLLLNLLLFPEPS